MSFIDRLNKTARMASGRSDVVVAAFVMTAVVMMVVPLPTVAVDALIGLNMCFTLLVLAVAFYISRPAQFSALPAIILLSTLFRLSLSITTTRLILLDGDAGEVVNAFGEFVIAGQIVVGLVVFLVITIAQFLVITKGAERVAEVAARFTLDAMPGKQMSIDADLRNGDIDKDVARTRRKSLERENQLYGAMDGAMKFVKGDAIAALIIVVVNLLGGLTVGMLQRGLSFADSIRTYSLLTVGDGLVAQIPALMVSLAAATVVTRVVSDEELDLGSEIFSQLGADYRALFLAAAIMFGFALLPGFPTIIFLTIAITLIAFGILLRRGKSSANPIPLARVEETIETVPGTVPSDLVPAQSTSTNRLVLRMDGGLTDRLFTSGFQERLASACNDLKQEFGIDIPAVGFVMEALPGPDRFRLDLDGVAIIEDSCHPGCVLVNESRENLERLSIVVESDAYLDLDGPRMWVAGENRSQLDKVGIASLDGEDVLLDRITTILKRYASHFMGIQETRALLSSMEDAYGDLVSEATRVLPIQKIADVLRRLLDEGIPIVNMRSILDALATSGESNSDVSIITDQVRVALARNICHQFARPDKILSVYMLSRAAEEAVASHGQGSLPVQHDGAMQAIIRKLQERQTNQSARTPVILLVSPEIRARLRGILVRNGIYSTVLSLSEIAPEFRVQSLATITTTREVSDLLPPEENRLKIVAG